MTASASLRAIRTVGLIFLKGSFTMTCDVCSKKDVEERALLKVLDITCLSNTADAALKAMRNSGVLMNFEKHFRQKKKTFLDIWFSDHTQEELHEAE